MHGVLGRRRRGIRFSGLTRHSNTAAPPPPRTFSPPPGEHSDHGTEESHAANDTAAYSAHIRPSTPTPIPTIRGIAPVRAPRARGVRPRGLVRRSLALGAGEQARDQRAGPAAVGEQLGGAAVGPAADHGRDRGRDLVGGLPAVVDAAPAQERQVEDRHPHVLPVALVRRVGAVVDPAHRHHLPVADRVARVPEAGGAALEDLRVRRGVVLLASCLYIYLSIYLYLRALSADR